MTALERRIDKLEGWLCLRQFFVLAAEYKRQQRVEAETRRRAEEEARAADHAARLARAAEEQARRAAEEARRAAEPPAATPPPPAPAPAPTLAPAPTPSPWTYERPESLQIRPVRWGPSVPSGPPEVANGRVRIHYDPLERGYFDVDDD